MPVMPAPTTSTSTSGGPGGDSRMCYPNGQYRSRLVDRTFPGCGDRGWSTVDTATGRVIRRSALPCRTRWRSRTGHRKERYFDPEFYRAGGRAALAPGLADGVPARGDPAAVRLRRVRDPRSVGRRRAHRRHGSAGVPERLPPSRRQGRRGPRDVRERLHLPVPRLVLRHRTARTPHVTAARDRSPSTTCSPTTSTSRRCGARRGAAAHGSTSTTTPRRCGECIEPFATILDAWKVESLRTEWWYACRLPVNWKLAEEAFVEQYHVMETHPQLGIPGRMLTASGRGPSIRARSSTPSCTTCAR